MAGRKLNLEPAKCIRSEANHWAKLNFCQPTSLVTDLVPFIERLVGTQTELTATECSWPACDRPEITNFKIRDLVEHLGLAERN